MIPAWSSSFCLLARVLNIVLFVMSESESRRGVGVKRSTSVKDVMQATLKMALARDIRQVTPQKQYLRLIV